MPAMLWLVICISALARMLLILAKRHPSKLGPTEQGHRARGRFYNSPNPSSYPSSLPRVRRKASRSWILHAADQSAGPAGTPPFKWKLETCTACAGSRSGFSGPGS